MWLNILFLGLACTSTGFIIGWILARPRRWDYVINPVINPVIDPQAGPAAPGQAGDVAPVVRLTR